MNSDGKSFPITRRQFVTVSAAGLAASAFAHQAHARVGAPEQPAGGPFRVIIDTDPGVDDALALLLAMRSPELKIERSEERRVGKEGRARWVQGHVKKDENKDE